jgi:2-alkenal reductase
MNQRKKNARYSTYFWLAGMVIIGLSLFAGTAVGGTAGFVLASRLSPVSEATVNNAPPPVLPEPVDSAPAPTATEKQSLVITEESAAVKAVETVLPAVVTVLSREQFSGGSGSGFFISHEGYVVTNNHVVEGARNLQIIYSQGGRAPATLIGTAPEFDLAVLKVDGPVPAVAEWGDSGELPLGAGVIAIGSALGQYQNSVTAGILSGFNRSLGGLNGLLQTDAAINHGNSGGPLISFGGQVIGINTMIVRGGLSEAEGLGFAIPSNIAQNVVLSLIETGQARQPFLGIQYQTLNPQLAGEEELTIVEGALLDSIVDGTPADRAGLRAGDVIIAVEGNPVDDRHSLVSLLLEHVAGDTITLEILRDGRVIETDLTLGERA